VIVASKSGGMSRLSFIDSYNDNGESKESASNKNMKKKNALLSKLNNASLVNRFKTINHE
jgi:hypothetical protein